MRDDYDDDDDDDNNNNKLLMQIRTPDCDASSWISTGNQFQTRLLRQFSLYYISFPPHDLQFIVMNAT
jgi:hypothetical protein